MRIITSLIIASVVGSTAVGALRHYLDGSSNEGSPRQALKTLFKEDRPAALRLFERATFACVPELDKLKSNNARVFFSRMLVVRIEMQEKNGDELTKDDKRRINKEIEQLLRVIPEADAIVFAGAVKTINTQKKKIQTCLVDTVAEYALQIQRKKKEALLSGVELRGS
ncbi:hypothetical protein IHQ71_14715 [Rhizobium sp. TH2]|uniref:hypothetical protein n=1 Tax=Rhizobium sp. TH2 TaxID=2775403 RepID=UPI002156FBA4|nr:hypothetical protein [Rhizobium sp. TH2]UVC06526.1 hypothetical protein IHQ71_14715 [Rhizobium sp. TH2]